MEAVTGLLTYCEMVQEIGAISHILNQFCRPMAIITYGGGCDWSQIGHNDQVIVSSLDLSDFIEELEEKGIFTIGSCDLVLDSADKTVQFLLCESSDIHCSTSDDRFFLAICERWAKLYPDSYELDKANRNRQRRFLSATVWTQFN